jgi:hypothetical protein
MSRPAPAWLASIRRWAAICYSVALLACATTYTVKSTMIAAGFAAPVGCEAAGIVMTADGRPSHDYARGAAEAEKRCTSDRDPEACALIGEMRLAGCGVAYDPADAARELWLACQGNHRIACGELARLHVDGRGVAKDERRGIELARIGCAAGHASSCTIVGAGQAFGLFGQPIEPDQARKTLDRGCQLGARPACELYRMFDALVRVTEPAAASHPAAPAPRT